MGHQSETVNKQSNQETIAIQALTAMKHNPLAMCGDPVTAQTTYHAPMAMNHDPVTMQTSMATRGDPMTAQTMQCAPKEIQHNSVTANSHGYTW